MRRGTVKQLAQSAWQKQRRAARDVTVLPRLSHLHHAVASQRAPHDAVHPPLAQALLRQAPRGFTLCVCLPAVAQHGIWSRGGGEGGGVEWLEAAASA